MNLFSLHGKYFRDDENRLTANLAVLLNEARRNFLPEFVRMAELKASSLENLEISFQDFNIQDEQRSILDAKLVLPGSFVAVIESKVGFNSINPQQAIKYARLLNSSTEDVRVLIFVTQLREPLVEAKVLEAITDAKIKNVRCVFLLWQQVFSALRTSEGLSELGERRCNRRIRKGLMVSSVQRFAYLFLKEVEKMAYDLSIIDELSVSEVEDVVVQVQDHWFMSVALDYNIWFPPSTSIRGLRPAKYVAYYQTIDPGNDRPKHISHVARIRKVWKRVSFADARVLPEFSAFFSNSELSDGVANFKNKEGLFHMAYTDTPVELAHPIPLGNPSKAQFLTKKRFPLTKLLAAKTADDLFLSKTITGVDDED